MFEPALPSDTTGHVPRSALSNIRADGGVRLRVTAGDGHSRIADVHEVGGYKLRFPRSRDGVVEAAIVNTGGGVAGGDQIAVGIDAGHGADACITTPAAERIYRAADELAARMDVSLSLGDAAKLAWLPQETILFDRARLKRRITADLPSSAKLLMAETLVFGRTAMGETFRSGLLQDRWTIRRDGRLVFAEAVRLDGDIARALSQAAAASGQAVVSTVLFVSEDAEDRLEAVRVALADSEDSAAASAWNGLLVIRIVASNSSDARSIIGRVAPVLSGRALPRIWLN